MLMPKVGSGGPLQPIVWTTMALLIGALWSQRALQLLCAAVRQTGVISYAEVAWTAFGNRAEMVVASLLHLYLLGLMARHLNVMKDLLDSLLIAQASLQLHGHAGLIMFCLLALVAMPTLTVRDVYPFRLVATACLICLVLVLILLYTVFFMSLLYLSLSI